MSRAARPGPRSIRARNLFVSLLILLVAAAACSSGGGNAAALPSATPFTLTPRQVLVQTRAAMEELSSFRFKLTHSRGATLLPGGFSVQEAEGVVSSPDKVSLSADTVLSGIFVKIDAVIFPDVTYMTNPLTRNWNLLEGDASPFSVFDPPGLISDILGEVSTVSFAEDGPLSDGTITLTGSVPASAMRRLVGGTDPASVVSYEMSIDPEEFRLISVDLGGLIRTGEDAGTRRRIELSEFNVPVTIEPPI